MIKDDIYQYLQIDQKNDSHIDAMIDECLKEIKDLASPKVMMRQFSITHHPLIIQDVNISLEYPALNKLLDSCDDIIIIAGTLGIAIDKQIRYLSKINLSKMVIYDACCNAYLESILDDYQNHHIFQKHTFRFGPGYNGVDISLLKQLANLLQTSKMIGLTVEDSNILLPQKSIIGIIGLGDNQPVKSCLGCIRIKDCQYLKEKKTCYKKDSIKTS